MHGSIISLVKRFICQKYTRSFWDEVSPQQDYDETKPYSEEWLHIVNQTAEKTGATPSSVLHDFGYYVVQELLYAHANMFGTEKSTFGYISNAETTMHSMARMQNASPPLIHANKVSPTLLIVDYHSKRRMSGMAVGIIQGIADYCKEEVVIEPKTEIEAERVQIWVHLKK